MSIATRNWSEDLVVRDRVGRFAEKHLADGGTDVDLSVPAPINPAERGTLVASGKYAPPTRTAISAPTTTTKAREKYWTDAIATAEYNHAKGVYAQMPDSYGKGHGHGLDGTRRVHRMNYSGSGVSMRMPSASAVKRFAKAQQGRTFDVPVAAEYPGGQVQGWVRVTPGPNGTYDVQGLNFSDSENAYVAESVRAVLESRRPSRALTEVGDILERRRQRQTANGAAMREIRSKALKRVGYDDATGTMVVTFANKDGSERGYGYKVDRETYDGVVTSASPGASYVYDVKQSGAERVQVENCSDCGRFYASSRPHVCAGRVSERDADGFVTNARAAEALAHPKPKEKPAPKPEPTPAPKPLPAQEKAPEHGKPVALNYLKKGDKVVVTKDGQTREYTVQGELRGEGPDGKFGAQEHKKVTIGYGPGRYNFEVSQAAIDAGFVKVSHPVESVSGQSAEPEPTPTPAPRPVTPKDDPKGWYESATKVSRDSGSFGPQGHTKAAFGALAPFLTESSTQSEARFAGALGKQRLAHVTKSLTKENLAHRASEKSPRTIDILKAAYLHGDQVSFGGKAVSPASPDERIELDEVFLTTGDEESMIRRKLRNGFPDSGEPATVEQVDVDWHESGKAWRITW